MQFAGMVDLLILTNWNVNPDKDNPPPLYLALLILTNWNVNLEKNYVNHIVENF